MSLSRNKVTGSGIHGSPLQNLFNVHLYLFHLADTFITLSMSSLCRPVLVSHHNHPREAGAGGNCVTDEDPETGTPEVPFSRSCDREVAGAEPQTTWLQSTESAFQLEGLLQPSCLQTEATAPPSFFSSSSSSLPHLRPRFPYSLLHKNLQGESFHRCERAHKKDEEGQEEVTEELKRFIMQGMKIPCVYFSRHCYFLRHRT